MIKYDYELIEDVKVENGIKFLGKKDIAAMKLMAVANRGDQAKDFIDIYYLLKEISLMDMFEYYKKKYKQNDISPMNLPALKGGVSCLRYKLDEVRSVRKLFNYGVYYHDF